MGERVWGFVAGGFLLACVFLGGASAAGAAANGVLQALSLALIVLIAWTRSPAATPPGARTLIAIVAVYALWCLVQLVPVPASLWSALPGRAGYAEAMRAMGAELPAMPLSLAPRKTLQSLLWLLPPVAMFLLVLRLTGRARRTLAYAVLAGALLSMLLGAFQVLGGEGSPLRFYEITNPTAPVGFFANKNHLATLLLSSLPVVAALAGREVARSQGRTHGHSRRMIYGSILLFLTIGIAMNRSVAGYALLLPAAAASFLIYRRLTSGRLSRRALAALGGLILAYVGIAVAGPVSTETLSSKFTTAPASRQVMTERTLEAAAAHLPTGSGLGTFQQIYRTYENPAEASRTFANHAHNDYAEIALELGLPGVLLVLAFFAWWAWRSLIAWRTDFRAAALARAASAVIGLVLFHSLVDYPLRTSAIAALFAAACALLLPAAATAPRVRASGATDEEPRARHLEAD